MDCFDHLGSMFDTFVLKFVNVFFNNELGYITCEIKNN